MAHTLPLEILGHRVAGDLGGITIYTDAQHRKIAYPIDHPKKQPSQRQVGARAEFRRAQAAWSALQPGEKAKLEDACRRLALTLTGQNLYISAALTRDRSAYSTVATQAGVIFPPLVDLDSAP